MRTYNPARYDSLPDVFLRRFNQAERSPTFIEVRLKRKLVTAVFTAVIPWFFTSCADSASSTVIKIGCAGPLTGDQAQIGSDMCQGARFAVDRANAAGRGLSGYTLEFVPLDDQHNPSQAVNVANRFAADPDVMGVIGHFNSSCTKPASAVYEASSLVHVTPGSTNPDLSKQGYATFFRVVATDEVQGPKGAEYAAGKLGAKRVFIIDDKTTYGKGLADQFEKRARQLNLEILGHEGITQGDKDFTPLLTRIKPLNPDAIYFGGIYPEGALLLRQARGLDIGCIFIGGDGIATPLLAELATPEIAEGVYATMVGGDIKADPQAQDFVAGYEARYGPVGQWTSFAFDSANILIAALEKAGRKDRGAVLEAMRQIPEFRGVTGKISFDERGDNKNQSIGIFRITDGRLAYVEPAQ